MALDKRAQQIFAYFKKYNYEVEGAGDVIRFVGNYKASRGQAAALTFYVFMGESTNLDPKSWHRQCNVPNSVWLFVVVDQTRSQGYNAALQN